MPNTKTKKTIVLAETLKTKNFIFANEYDIDKNGKEFIKKIGIGYTGMKESDLVPASGRKYRYDGQKLHVLFRGPLVPADEAHFPKFKKVDGQRPNGYYSFGMSPKYTYKTTGIDKSPENISGYQFHVSLSDSEYKLGDDTPLTKPFDTIKKAVCKYLSANKKRLPKAFKSMDEEELLACVKPIYVPGKLNKKTDKVYGPSLYATVKHWKNNELGERVTTIIKTHDQAEPIEQVADIEDPFGLHNVNGRVIFQLVLDNVTFYSNDKIDVISIRCELGYVRYHKLESQQEDDGMGEFEDEDDDDFDDIDPTVDYGDNAENS